MALGLRACGVIAWVLVIAASSAAAVASPSPAGARTGDSSIAGAPFTPDQEVVLELRLRRYVLDEGLVAYDTPEGLFLPLSSLSDALDVALQVHAQEGRAEGWIFQETRTFRLDVGSRSVRFKESEQRLQAGDVRIVHDEIYVISSRLAEWLSIQLRYRREESMLLVLAEYPLPFELALQRRQRVSDPSNARDQPELPEIQTPYELASWPAADLTFDGVAREKQASGRDARLSGLWSGDLFRAGFRGFASLNGADGLEDLRLRFERRSTLDSADDTAPSIAEFSVGDIYSDRTTLVGRGGPVRGVRFSRRYSRPGSAFEVTTIRGDIPPGWDVELFRNGVLLQSANATSDGRYEFIEVPVLLGSNLFTLVKHGPQGERREETQRIVGGARTLPAGQSEFRVAAGQRARALPWGQFDGRMKHATSHGLPMVAEAEGSYGLGHGMTASLSGSRIDLDGQVHDYVTGSLDGQALGVSGRLDLAKDLRAGEAAEMSLLTQVGAATIVLSHARFARFSSEATLDAGFDLEERSRLRVTRSFRVVDLPASASLDTSVSQGARGSSESEVDLRLSTYFRSIAMTHTLRAERRVAQDALARSHVVDGVLGLSGRVSNRSALRGEMVYPIDTQTAGWRVRMGWEHALDESRYLRISAQRTVDSTTRQSVTLSTGRRSERTTQGFYLLWDDERGVELGTTWRFGVRQDPLEGKWSMQAQAAADFGSIAPVVYLDRDMNGVRGPADTVIENVKLEGREAASMTGPTVGNVSPYLPTRIAVDEASLPDPSWTARTRAYRVVPRPGRTTVVEIPVVVTGDVEGTVWMRTATGQEPASNVKVQLLHLDDGTVAEARSGFDGFFLFERITPGRYRLSVDADQLARRNLALAQEVAVILDAENPVIRGADLQLVRKEAVTTEGSRDVP